ncbi:MAG TPA: nucleotidyl transferase AbiEii/AbiGii toxin family protein [Gemmatimonadales bacterium]|nr:nucleotidyl transferase AbiEii/AbiGii toxin family protein [Gemmatimonadales bacterium]
MKTLLQAGARVQELFEQRSWRFCFIGGVANFRWGTPRLTNDLDLTLLTGFGPEAEYISELLGQFAARIPDAAGFAAQHRVLLLRTPDGFGLDIALGAMPFEAGTIERSSEAELVPGAKLRTCSAEDLIVHKAFAARPQDWVDVEGIILKQRGRLDWPQIWADLTDLAALKEAPELVDELERIAQRAEQVIGPFPRER